MIQNLNAYFIHYIIAIELVMCAQEKIELFRMSQQSRLNMIVTTSNIPERIANFVSIFNRHIH